MTSSVRNLPRILIVDDDFHPGSEMRRCVLESLSVWDRSLGPHPPSDKAYLAEADICTAIRKGVFCEDELTAQVKRLSEPHQWALVLVDRNFAVKGGLAPKAYNVIKTLSEKVAVDQETFVLFTSSKTSSKELKSLGCSGCIYKSESEASRQTFARLLFQHGLFADGPVRLLDNHGKVVTGDDPGSDLFYGKTTPTLRVLREARRLLLQWAIDYTPFLITGQAGDGKTQLARYMHRWSEAALACTEPPRTAQPPRQLRVISSGEVGSAFLAGLLLEGKFRPLSELLQMMENDTILIQETSSFDTGTLAGLLRVFSQKASTCSGLHVFTTSLEQDQLNEIGSMGPTCLVRIPMISMPRLRRRLDAGDMFLWQLANERAKLHLDGSAQLSVVARKLLEEGSDVLTVGRLKGVAILAARWQMANRENEAGLQIDAPTLREFLRQTKSEEAPKTGLAELLLRIKRYQISDDDDLQGGLGKLRESVDQLFGQMLEKAARKTARISREPSNILTPKNSKITPTLPGVYEMVGSSFLGVPSPTHRNSSGRMPNDC